MNQILAFALGATLGTAIAFLARAPAMPEPTFAVTEKSDRLDYAKQERTFVFIEKSDRLDYVEQRPPIPPR